MIATCIAFDKCRASGTSFCTCTVHVGSQLILITYMRVRVNFAHFFSTAFARTSAATGQGTVNELA